MDLNKLDEPFTPEDIEWRIQQSGKTRDGKVWAMVLAYVTNRAIMKRLDDVCGKAGWRNEYRDIPNNGGVECGISIKVDGEWVTKWDAAENTQVEAVKGGRSGAMKRAAVQWGIGRYLYNLEEGFAQISTDKKQGWNRAKLKDGTGFFWLPPSLPSWAVPKTIVDHPVDSENESIQQVPSEYDHHEILQSFTEYAGTETDKKKLIERYQHDWQLLAGDEDSQEKCVEVMNIRINELKKAA
ncbi:Rad52/Rad22 family DNA repair protein [Cronobacter sakazakii]|uniref:Rad52/Rad22 family DNA repair protein n=1 Tax=Cronobacter sakazakii TaxID=28141 RepID=UPI000B4B279A|nr:Rad52/Rad22 family DNA repair protein [Cronobacter sakazakii]PUY57984.1 recombinase [Cronobacter sakazakii]